jgi:hypothetical protein
METGSSKAALFTLCGLLALAIATTQEDRVVASGVSSPEA